MARPPHTYPADPLWEQYEQHLLNEGLTKVRRVKLRSMYWCVRRGIPVTLDVATREQIESFLHDVNTDQFKRADGENLSGSTKKDIKTFIKQFWKWMKGDNEYYPREVAWIKARIAKDERPPEKEVITLEEAQRLAASFDRPEFAAMTLLLFDCGFRIGELLSMQKRDLTLEDYEPGQECFWVRCRKSKTIQRKVPVPQFTADLQLFINSSYYRSKREDDLLFPYSYNTVYLQLRQHGERVLRKRLSPHCFRHSSATFYASVFDGHMMMLAERYGWEADSDQLKTYIRRSGAYQKPQAKKVANNKVAELEAELTLLKKKQAEYDKLFDALREKTLSGHRV